MFYDLLILTSHIIGIIAFLTALIALYLFPRLIFSLKLLCIYVVIASSSETVAMALVDVGKPNIFTYHFYVFFEFFFLSIFFYQEFRRNGKTLPLIPILIGGTSLIIANTIFLQPLDTFNSYSATLVSLLMLVYCIYYFMLSLENSNESNLFNTLKWIVTSIFLFHCVSIVVLLFSNMIMKMEDVYNSAIWFTRSIILLAIKLIILYQFIRMLKFHFSNKRLINDGQ